MFVFIAQGGGFYGSAFCTIEKDFNDLKTRLNTSFNNVHINDIEQSGSIYLGQDTIVLFHPWEGSAQPDPVVLFDSGHKVEDLDALSQIQIALS